MKYRIILLISIIISIIALYFFSPAQNIEEIKLQDIEQAEGKNVVIEGTVKDIYSTNQRNTIIKLSDGNITVTVFVRGEVSIQCGDKIKVTGKVVRYNNEISVFVESKDFIVVIESWNKSYFELSSFYTVYEKHINENINITGYAKNVKHREFTLVDNKTNWRYSLPVEIKKTINLPPANKQIYVTGRFIFDSERYAYIISIEDIFHGIEIYE